MMLHLVLKTQKKNLMNCSQHYEENNNEVTFDSDTTCMSSHMATGQPANGDEPQALLVRMLMTNKRNDFILNAPGFMGSSGRSKLSSG